MKILLLGSTGQIGSAILELAKAPTFPIGFSIHTLNRLEVDFKDQVALTEKIKSFQPDLIINAAAYTQVDQAEIEKMEASSINSKLPEVLSSFCVENKIPLIHFSSDYVYSGEGNSKHLETEKHHPLNFYGESKARGDEAILHSGCEYLIFRTSWVYSWNGRNFVKTMLSISKEKEEIQVVQDQFGAPSYAPDLARYALDALMLALEQRVKTGVFPSGIYHLCNSGETNWCEFAKAILPGKKVIGILSSAYPTRAKRPLNSRLSLEKFETTFNIKPRSWELALQDCLKKMKE